MCLSVYSLGHVKRALVCEWGMASARVVGLARMNVTWFRLKSPKFVIPLNASQPERKCWKKDANGWSDLISRDSSAGLARGSAVEWSAVCLEPIGPLDEVGPSAGTCSLDMSLCILHPSLGLQQTGAPESR